uniref:Protein kinase domain-containing protein n=1 Tax=Acrobeloides nanus TaxID=290746 RepID=A0A914EKY7_9BILA
NSQECWSRCKDLPGRSNDGKALEAIANFTGIYNSVYRLDLKWSPVQNADLYLVVYYPTDNPFNVKYLKTTQPFVNDFNPDNINICQELDVQVIPISSDTGAGPATSPIPIPPPKPKVSQKLKLLSMVFEPVPFEASDYSDNATITITLEYSKTDWPLTDMDLEVIPIFHMISCFIPDMSVAVPNPEFYKGRAPNTIQSKMGAAMMYRRCSFFYAVQEVRSKRCGTTSYITEQNGFDKVLISCDNVQNNDCPKIERIKAPVCGRVDNFTYEVMNESIDGNMPDSNITVNVTFNPLTKPPEKPSKPLYYVAIYGYAETYGPGSELINGVKMTNKIGNASNCIRFAPDGRNCSSTNEDFNSIIISNLSMDTTYGVMICGVMDPRNLTFPEVNISNKALRIRADVIFIDSSDYIKSNKSLIIGLCAAAAILCLTIGFCVLIYFNRRQARKLQAKKLKLEMMQRESEQQRYTDFPRKNDLWELERRNLIIYEDGKLGSGAFGAVYKGKLIGKANGSKDARSTLGVNLMRVENCEVAVKMLPEYADELSKSEFLREIALMKTLGYHERLVNMLACITESEPYCLVVEYCSDGDLLHFLRERCKYMLKLDEQQIDYSSPECEAEFDREMIMTVKQLLMFAVQISYGLEYLSQKGFVHRDVAARNVLVHQKQYAKIGDFGLCRFIYAESANYKSKGGRLPIKWMSPEAIRHYEFTAKSDVWSFGILMFEIITLGGTPYPGIQPDDILTYLESGCRMQQPDNCPDDYYSVMKSCWTTSLDERPDFSFIRQRLAQQLERITDEYCYLKLDAQKDYYNMQYRDQSNKEVIIPPDPPTQKKSPPPLPPRPAPPSIMETSLTKLEDKRVPLEHTISGNSEQFLIKASKDSDSMEVSSISLSENDEALKGIANPLFIKD